MLYVIRTTFKIILDFNNEESKAYGILDKISSDSNTITNNKIHTNNIPIYLEKFKSVINLLYYIKKVYYMTLNYLLENYLNNLKAKLFDIYYLM